MIRHSTPCIFALAAMLSLFPAAAQEAEQPPAPPAQPGCEGLAYRAFDFWIGDWEVRTPDGQLAGTNSIQPINGGCALLERYSQGGNPAGQSYNFYDPVREIWTQLWLSPGVIIRIEGPIAEPGTLTLAGTITYTNQPAPRAFTGRWTLQEDGTVLQEFWEQDPGSGEWTNWFTGIYIRSD
ncbi:hypothetical protein [Parasphingopyxis marina]|uniref:DUF1579 domain-containing protein n=1 Tax=Parasphingopyxis marina TaxID=2761622 RepID=A0A842I052_9SPHN|nr:hypothetical protein [Parasphingopyxis marina]MBC2778207.1 hypothetical protein [Parasphingopyxis marina]